RAFDLAVHDLGADAAFADEQAFVHQILDRLADGGPGQAEPVGELDLVVQAAARGQVTLFDRLGDLLGDLEIERHRAGPVQGDVELGAHGVLHRCGPYIGRGHSK